MKRIFDAALAGLILILLLPLALFAILGGLYRKKILVRKSCIGKNQKKILLYRFSTGWPRWMKDYPLFFSILKGDLSIVGPRAISTEQYLIDREKLEKYRARFDIKPGLISLAKLRSQAQIDYSSEYEIDNEYAKNHSLLSDVGLILRAMLSGIGYVKPNEHQNTLKILGVRVHNLTMDAALKEIESKIASHQKHHIAFLNAEYANQAYKNSTYRAVLNQASLVLADGVGLRIAGKWLHQPVRQNINGTDLFPLLLEKMSQQKQSIFMLGSKPGNTDLVAAWVQSHFPGVRIAGHCHGYFKPEEESDIIQAINQSKPDLLIVCFGGVAQDLWIDQHKNQLDCKVMMSAGGLFDFYSGSVPRAPLWMREIGCEWVFRLIQEPKRLWKRYLLGNGVFLWRILLYKFFGKKSSFREKTAEEPLTLQPPL